MTNAERAVIEAAKWVSIEKHDGSTDEVLIAIFDSEGRLYHADRGWWVPGEVREEWEEVEDGVCVKVWEDEEDGCWSSNYGTLENPTHFLPLDGAKKEATDDT